MGWQIPYLGEYHPKISGYFCPYKSCDEEFDICFNVTYLIENLNILESETVELKLSDATNSLLIHEPHNTFDSIFVVMPMRL